MYEPKLEDFFNRGACDYCGECLSKCPELGDRISDPKACIQSLVEGEYVPEVLERCSSCMSCNTVCPYDCNPYGLILYRWHQRIREKGLPVRASLVMPLEEDNAWHKVMAKVPPDERARLDEWSDLSRPGLRKNAMFAGCNLQILPYLASSRLFEEYDIFGRPDLCCGEVYYRMGAFDKVEGIARNLESVYRETDIREVVAYCQACYNIMKNVLPTYFSADFPFELTYFGDILADKVLSGELGVKGKLQGLKVTIQDPCHSKVLGPDFRRKPRQVLEYLGCDIREMEHNNAMSLCCGLGHGAPRYNPLDMAGGIIRRLREAKATGAEQLVVYCNSCDLLFSVGTQVTPFIIPVYHLNELVSSALDEPMPRRNLARARSMIGELFVRGAPKVLSRKRFFLERPG